MRKTHTKKIRAALDGCGIENGLELFQGTHASRLARRFQDHVPLFFSDDLCFTQDCK